MGLKQSLVQHIAVYGIITVIGFVIAIIVASSVLYTQVALNPNA